MTKYLSAISIMLIAFLFEGKIYAQYDLPKRWDKCAIRIDRLSSDISPLGTGFFICKEQEDDVYVVTNRHIVENRDSLIFTYFTVDSGFVRKKGSLKNNLVTHPDSSVDLAIYLFTEDDLVSCLGIERIMSSKELVKGQIIYIFGYPLGRHLGSPDSIFPMPKDGEVLFIEEKELILSCLSYSGNSGSPVLTSNRYSKDEHSKIVGIVNSHLENPTTKEVGLAAAIKADRLIELLDYVEKHTKSKKEILKFLEDLKKINAERKMAGLPILNTCVQMYHFDLRWAKAMAHCSEIIDSLQKAGIQPDSTKVFKP